MYTVSVDRDPALNIVPLSVIHICCSDFVFLSIVRSAMVGTTTLDPSTQSTSFLPDAPDLKTDSPISPRDNHNNNTATQQLRQLRSSPRGIPSRRNSIGSGILPQKPFAPTVVLDGSKLILRLGKTVIPM